MAEDVTAFYDQLAEHYHLIFADWDRSIAWHREVLEGLLTAAGFREVCWSMPDETGYHQPIVTARK